MNFNPQPVPQRLTGERAEAPDPVTARLPARDTRVKTLAPAAVFASVSRVDNSKRGFHNHFATNYAIVNVEDLNKFVDGTVVDIDMLLAARIIRKPMDGLKVLGNGELTKKLTVKAAVFSASAKEKIEAAGGKAEEV